MYSLFRMITWVGMMSLTISGLTGCEEKRIHVATLSGTAGAPEEPMGTEAPVPNDTADMAGLPGEAFDESSLSGTSSQENLPVAQADEIPSSTSESLMPESLSPSNADQLSSTGEGINGFPLSDGSSLHTQSGTSGSDLPSTLPGTSLADLGESDGSTPMALSNASENVPAPAGEAFNPNAAQDADMEQISPLIQVAKVEPSDALRQQLDTMKSEELASATDDLEDVFFQFDSWSLTEEGKQALERNMGWIKQDQSAKLIIEGHADQRGTQAYNMILGKRRAATIRDYLHKLGVDNQRLAVISYGKDKPFCLDQTEVCHQLNRRGHLLVQNP